MSWCKPATKKEREEALLHSLRTMPWDHANARMLVDKLVKTKSQSVQVHMVAALSHLGSHAAVDPLLKVLLDKRGKHTMRESAAAALGILVDDRAHDPLFEIDAHTNPYGLTIAGRALVVVY